MDPDSAQADELRQLLNIVSGRAPDSQGLVSEPLVKEELAIVEFLTAKTNYAKAPPVNQTANAPDKQRADDQTPVDLLLGLAKTRSGKRAAEEEKRQLRLQQHREMEEQRAAANRRNGSDMSSPWGYVAPSMPGLDVQQPFGGQGKKGPRPLQPPRTKRPQGDLASFMSDSSPPWASSSSERRDGLFDPFNGVNGARQEPSPNAPLQSPQNRFDGANNGQISPFATMSTLPINNAEFVNQQMMFDQTQHQQMEGAQQFGRAMIDQFDFSDLGIGLAGGPGGGANNGLVASSGSVIDGSQFNPFALAQNQTEEG